VEEPFTDNCIRIVDLPDIMSVELVLNAKSSKNGKEAWTKTEQELIERDGIEKARTYPEKVRDFYALGKLHLRNKCKRDVSIEEIDEIYAEEMKHEHRFRYEKPKN
jgi:hypothetical protein